MNHKYLRSCLTILGMLLLLAGMVQAKDKAEQFFKDGQAAEQKSDWDTALSLYMQAVDLKPKDTGYMIAMRRARFEAGQKHVNAGQKVRTEGKLEDALAEFQKALIADPSSSIAIQEIKQTQEMIDRQKTSPTSADQRGLTPIQEAHREADQRIGSIEGPPELKPVLRTVGPFKINNQPPKVIYETVGKLAGVNVLFDSAYNPPNRNFNVDLSQTTPEQAFDYLAVLTHTFWKPISAKAIFVAEDSPTKHRDFDNEVVKTFYCTNVTSVQEFQEIATAVRTIADLRRVFTYTPQKAIIIRGPEDSVALAGKIIRDMDKPKSEVIVDVMVMQADSTRTRDLAASLVNASTGTAGLNVPFVFTPRNPVLINGTNGISGGSGASGASGATGGTGGTGVVGQLVSLAGLSHISTNDFSTSLPNALLNMMLTDSKTKVLNNPQLRVSDGMKAEMKIGQRIPYATGSFQPGVGTVGVSPLVSTQFNFVDTGVNLLITPQVHSATEVTLHVEVEVSSVVQYVNLGGISQPIIGQNKDTADLRLRDGEVNILGGLSQLADAKSISGIPGLVNIPVLGDVLFGGQHTQKDNSQLLIALIPHIVRTPDYTENNLREIYAGDDQNIKLLYNQPAPQPSASAPAPAASNPPAAANANGQPIGQPNNQPPAAPGQAQVSFAPAAIQATVGNPVTVTIQVANAADLFSGSPVRIKFNPTQLRLNDIAPGDLLTRGGARTTSVKDIRNDTGEATLTISRLPGSQGISGSGAIAVLNFVAIGKGSSTITADGSALKNSQQQPISVTLGELPVRVQ